jgi:hypothetical protein
VTSTSTAPVDPTIALTALDRCDRCGAQAYVRATLPSGSELLFCAHHAREFDSKLRDMDATIYDETTKLEPVVATPER